MSNYMSGFVKLVNHSDINPSRYPHQFVGCLVLTKDNKILLQQRGRDWAAYPGYLCEFGGKIEKGETPVQAIIRELKEELGAQVLECDLIVLGVITEPMSKHNDLIYAFFWPDKKGTVTGCYEGEALFFDDSATILNHAEITDGLRWVLAECKQRGLII
ncbi:TPA: NUDIX domain-containing protein [Legionella pneumophila]